MQFSIFYPVGWYHDTPIRLEALYENAIQTAEHAEKLGFHGIFFNEGHMRHPNYRMPNPRLLIASIAQRTSTIRLGTAVIALGLQDPRFLAEDCVMLDALSNGRFVLGIGTGNPPQYKEFCLDPNLRREIYNFKRKIFEALVNNNTINVSHELFRAHEAQLSILPEYADFWERMYQGTVSVEGAKAIGAAGWRLIYTPKNTPSMGENIDFPQTMREVVQAYKESFASSPRAGERYVAPMTHVPCYIADSVDAARAEIGAEWELYCKILLGRRSAYPLEYYTRHEQDGVSLFGDANTCRERASTIFNTGIGNIMCMFNIGRIDHQHMLDVMQRFAEEVIHPMQQAHNAPSREHAEV